MQSQTMRHDWTRDEILAIYQLPLTELLFRAQTIHRQSFDPARVQMCTLLSIKTGGCPEDCAYCPQSAHYNTGVEKQKLLTVEAVQSAAAKAKAGGSTRFCMGAAWRQVRDGDEFDRVLEMVRSVAALDMEVCCTLGMINESQAKRLAAAGLKAYNHNLDTAPEYYEQIISTRDYQDRLSTLDNVRNAGINVCCGGIIGMGESLAGRVGLLAALAGQRPHPESVPINALVRVEGTPLADKAPVDSIDFVRMVATARIVLPTSRIRLSAGRTEMSLETQALCFMAGANSIFTGDKLLTTPNPEHSADHQLLSKLGLQAEVA